MATVSRETPKTIPWKEIRKSLAMQESTAALVCVLPAKKEVYRCIRSSQYALENYKTLESIGAFEYVGKLMLMSDSEIEDLDLVKHWLATRHERTIRVKPADMSAADFSALLNAIK